MNELAKAIDLLRRMRKSYFDYKEDNTDEETRTIEEVDVFLKEMDDAGTKG